MRVIVLGAGIAGCAAALTFTRSGHDVVVLDRDDVRSFDDWSAEEVVQWWRRSGIVQFRQPHNFLGLARVVLRDRFADVYTAVRQAGAAEVRQDSLLGDAARQAGDEDLATVACRRPVFEAALCAAVAAQAQVTSRRTEVIGLRLRPHGHAPHVMGVELASGESLTADLVVDATGRRSGTSDWLSAAGARPLPSVSSECGLLYYSRHYRIRDGEPMPPYASLLGGPRGDLGYLAFATFLGDNRTFCLCIMAPPWDRALRELRDPAAFQRVAVLLPGLAAWLEASDPVSGVLPMGQLRSGRPCRSGTPSAWPTSLSTPPTTPTSSPPSNPRSARMRQRGFTQSAPRTATGPGGGPASRSTSPTPPSPCRCSFASSSIRPRPETPTCCAPWRAESTRSTRSIDSPRTRSCWTAPAHCTQKPQQIGPPSRRDPLILAALFE